MSDTIPSSFWRIITPGLYAALMGCHKQHGIISTRKAIAALRYNPNIIKILQNMETEKIPTDQNSTPYHGECSTVGIKASPCVINTAHALLKEYKEGRVKVNEEEFFLKLVEVSCGPTVEKWREDGYNRARVTEMMRGVKEREGERYVTREEYNNFRIFNGSEGSEYRGGESEYRGSEYRGEGSEYRGSEYRGSEYRGEGSKKSESASSNNNNKGNAQSDEEDAKCKICFEKDINTVVVPCGHIAICFDCGGNMAQCPICRANVTQILRTYKA